MIASFPTLLMVCDAWHDVTFPDLVATAGNVSAVAATMQATLKDIEQTLLKSETDDLSAATVNDLQAQFQSIAAQSTGLSSQVTALNAAIHQFADANAVADSQAAAHRDALGSGWLARAATVFTTVLADAQDSAHRDALDIDWESVTGPVGALKVAIGTVEGSWGALNDDLQAIASGQIVVTTALLTSLAIDSTFAGWVEVATAAARFGTLAPGWAALMDGSE